MAGAPLEARPEVASTNLLARALADAWPPSASLLFCVRRAYNDGHWYANIGYYCDNENAKAYAGNGQPDAGQLLRLDPATGQVTVLFEAPGGSVRDPQVHYDGDRVLFSHRPPGTDFYHLYEIRIDGTGLRQITDGPFDDYEPTYLPDGDLVFVSTRCRRWVNCWMTQVGVMYRCDARGGNLRDISGNTEHDNTPWPLPDGRLLYTRWEYVDRSQVEFHHLWVMNPDGTGQAVFYGNMHPNIVMIDAKPVPGTDLVLANFSPGHGVTDHAGIATLVTAASGPDERSAARSLHQGRLIRDPYPIAPDLFLAARDHEIVLMDAAGAVQVLYRHPDKLGVHEPRPLLPRPRERIIPDRDNPQRATGVLVLEDVYNSRNLPGVQRGEIRKLLVLESLPKPVNFSGGPDLVSWLGTFTLERVLGTVPVEADGSACFEVPAGRQLFFVALDEHDLSVKRMQSFCSVRPGETTGCVGCHEPRARTPQHQRNDAPLAVRRPPSRIEPFTGLPDVLDFHRDIQPILDRHCVECHNPTRREGKVLLTGDLGSTWALSYFSLFAHREVADGRNGLGNQPPRTIGSSASPLLRRLGRREKVTPEEWRTLWLWIESGAPYAGTYAALRNERQQAAAGIATGLVFGGERAVLDRRCSQCHSVTGDGENHAMPLPVRVEEWRRNRAKLNRPTAAYERVVLENDPIARFSAHILLNFTRPELSSLLLAPLAKEAGGWGSCGQVFANEQDADYQRLLAALRQGKAALEAEPRFATPGFRPNRQYLREMKKYGVLPAAFDPSRDPLDVFATDQAYWRSLWSTPPGELGRVEPLDRQTGVSWVWARDPGR